MKTSNHLPKHKGIKWQEKAIRDKRGRPTASGYSATIRLNRSDFSSRGTSAWLYLNETGRQHDVLSKVEKQIGMMLAYLGSTEMWEQYRLSLDYRDVDGSSEWELPPGTQELCNQLSIRHPAYSKQHLKFMTTDWVIKSASNRTYACFVKYENEVPKPGTRQHDLALVQNKYWECRGVPMFVLTERCVDASLIIDLMWANDGGREHPQGAPREFLDFLRQQFNQERGLIEQLALWLGKENSTNALLLFKAAVHSGQIRLKTSSRNPLHLPNLNAPRPFEIVKPNVRKNQLSSFFKHMEIFHE